MSNVRLEVPPGNPPAVPNGDATKQAVHPLVSGKLVVWDASCTNVPYAYGVAEDSTEGRHFFSRAHLDRGVVPEVLNIGDTLEFHILHTRETSFNGSASPSWAYNIRRPNCRRRGRLVNASAAAQEMEVSSVRSPYGSLVLSSSSASTRSGAVHDAAMCTSICTSAAAIALASNAAPCPSASSSAMALEARGTLSGTTAVPQRTRRRWVRLEQFVVDRDDIVIDGSSSTEVDSAPPLQMVSGKGAHRAISKQGSKFADSLRQRFSRRIHSPSTPQTLALQAEFHERHAGPPTRGKSIGKHSAVTTPASAGRKSHHVRGAASGSGLPQNAGGPGLQALVRHGKRHRASASQRESTAGKAHGEQEMTWSQLATTLIRSRCHDPAVWNHAISEFFATPLSALFEDELLHINHVIADRFEAVGGRGQVPCVRWNGVVWP